MVTAKILDAIDFGIENEKENLSPFVIFKVMEGVNLNKQDPNYDLYKRAIEIALKRGYPAFSFIDASYNKKFYKEKDPDSEVAYSASNIRVMENIIDSDKQISSQRGNLSFTTINLARIGIKTSPILNKAEKNKRGKYEEFYEALEDTLNLVKEQLLDRFEVQGNKKAYEFPFFIKQGICLDGEKVRNEDKIRRVIKHGTLNIGFMGLEECVYALTKKKREDNKEAEKIAIQIVKFMKEKVDEYSNKYNLNFCLMGTDDMELSKEFMATDKAIYGTIPGITDKKEYTNSFYISNGSSKFNPKQLQQKIEIEGQYHKFTIGGHVERINIEKNWNTQALEKILRMCKNSDIGFIRFIINNS